MLEVAWEELVGRRAKAVRPDRRSVEAGIDPADSTSAEPMTFAVGSVDWDRCVAGVTGEPDGTGKPSDVNEFR